MRIEVERFTLKLKHTFTIARGSRDTVENVIVKLSDDGVIGLGEATANPYYQIDANKISSDLVAAKDFLDGYLFTTPEKLWQDISPKLKSNPFALCALDEAAHDLYGKLKGNPLHQLWGLDTKKAPLSNYTIGIDEVELMLEKVEQMPWPLYKIKLGTEHDLEIIKALRKASDAVFRVDANGGWSVEQCILFSEEFTKLGVEFIEQPLPASTSHEEKLEVFNHAKLPLVADENCIVEEDVVKCKDYFHGVNIKLMKCGGITPALRMINDAKKLGLKVMVGCMTESSIGIAAIAQLSPLLDYVDMDGAMLLNNDPAEGIRLEYGKIMFNNHAGSGASLK